MSFILYMVESKNGVRDSFSTGLAKIRLQFPANIYKMVMPEGGVVGPMRFNGPSRRLGAPKKTRNRWELNILGVAAGFREGIHGRL